MSAKTKAFVVTNGVIMQKVAGEMKPHYKGDKVKLVVGDDGLPVNLGIRAKVEAARRAKVVTKEDEASSE